jgi:hypothetical protein
VITDVQAWFLIVEVGAVGVIIATIIAIITIVN